jgi:uncharacterized protein VirK/YbjX
MSHVQSRLADRERLHAKADAIGQSLEARDDFFHHDVAIDRRPKREICRETRASENDARPGA